MLTSEIERLNNILRQKNADIDEWRSKYSQLSGLQVQVSEYENRIALLTSEIERLNNIIR